MNTLKPTHCTRISAKEKEFFCARRTLARTNFWTFYTEHQNFIDSLIAIWSWSYAGKYDLDDIHQEVLCKLHANDVLVQYDPRLSNLNTFLTTKIKHYISHVVRDMDASKLDSIEFNESRHGIREDGFDGISFNDSLAKLKEAVSPQLWKFVCLLQEGYTVADIEKIKKITRSCITCRYMRVLKSIAIQKLF